jgi:uracil-DNA glycosylase family 4
MNDTWEDEVDVMKCPACGSDEIVPPAGKKDSPILIVGEFPGEEEIKEGRPFVGAMGSIFKIELSKLGIDMKALRICNLWQHPPTKNKECLDYGMKTVIAEAVDRKAILLIGSDTVKLFCDKSVAATTGLEVKSPYLSAPLVMSCIQPAIVFHSSVGEFRLSLQKFAFRIEGLL